jgi:hypothetical protein
MGKKIEGCLRGTKVKVLLRSAVHKKASQDGGLQKLSLELGKSKNYFNAILNSVTGNVTFKSGSEWIPHVFPELKKSWLTKEVSDKTGKTLLVLKPESVDFLTNFVGGFKVPPKKKRKFPVVAEKGVVQVRQNIPLPIIADLIWAVKNEEVFARLLRIADEVEGQNFSLGRLLRQINGSVQG